MNTNRKRKYPYIVARDKSKANKWEFYLTIKPNKRVYLQGISKKRLEQIYKKRASNVYVKESSKLENGHRSKPRLARTFYRAVFGEEAIATKLR